MNTLTDEEILFMKTTIQSGSLYLVGRNKVWVKAFKYYNDNHEKKMGMFCAPCYGKVLHYCIQMKSQPENISTNANNS